MLQAKFLGQKQVSLQTFQVVIQVSSFHVESLLLMVMVERLDHSMRGRSTFFPGFKQYMIWRKTNMSYTVQILCHPSDNRIRGGARIFVEEEEGHKGSLVMLSKIICQPLSAARMLTGSI